MKYLVETGFVLHESHVEYRDDTPVLGAYEGHLRERYEHGPYVSESGAKRKFNRIKKTYLAQGYRVKVNHPFVLTHPAGLPEIEFHILDREISRKRIS